MDKFNYTYEANGNQLLGVSDNATVSYNLGDFNDAHQGTDYAYDNNGNLTQDLNKGITNVTYTHFNKPQTISFVNGNKIAYSYDASGSKIQEWVSADNKIKRTDYIGNFIYENDTLHQAMTPQGRTVWENGSPSEEFFVKDHLGNIRTIIETKIKPLKNYLGKYELASANIEDLFFEHHDEIRDDKPGSTDPSDMKAGRLNGAEQEHRIGTALLLKVMAGDKIELHVDNYYENYEPGSDDPVSTEDLLADLISTLSGGIGGLGESERRSPL